MNTPLEGTNNGLKHSSISTHQGLSMDNSMVILNLLSDKHVQNINGNVIRHNRRERINYLDNVHNKFTSMASSMIANMIKIVPQYETIRVGDTEWRFKKKKRPSSKPIRSCIPDFDVPNIVTVVDTENSSVKQLMCSYGYNKVYGLPCVHTLVEAKVSHKNGCTLHIMMYV